MGNLLDSLRRLRRLSNKLPTEEVHDDFRKKVGHVQRTGQAPAPWIVNAFKSLRVTWFLEASSDEIATMSMRENIGRAIPKAKAQRVRQHLPSQKVDRLDGRIGIHGI